MVDPTSIDTTWEMVQALPSRQRAAVALRFYADLSVTETAEAMGCSVGAVKTHTARGLAKLRACAGRRRRVMTDLFERRLAERLQAHPLPEEIPDLGTRSVRLGERMRRRRIGAVVRGLGRPVDGPGRSWTVAVCGRYRGTAREQPHEPAASDFHWRENGDPRPRAISLGAPLHKSAPYAEVRCRSRLRKL